MKNIGILTKSIDNPTCVEELTILIEKNPSWSIIIFYQEYGNIPTGNRICTMQNRYAWEFDGHFIAIDLESALSLEHMNNSGLLFYYSQNIDWMIYPNSLQFYLDIYYNNNIKIISNSEENFNITKKMWQAPIGVIENYNHEEITTIIKKYCL